MLGTIQIRLLEQFRLWIYPLLLLEFSPSLVTLFLASSPWLPRSNELANERTDVDLCECLIELVLISPNPFQKNWPSVLKSGTTGQP